MATRPNRLPLKGSIKYWNIMVFGDPGAGKTVFAGSDTKVLFVAPENDGLMSAERMGSSAEHIEIKHWLDLKNVYEWYDAHPDELADTNVLSIDSISEMQRLAKEYVLETGKEEKIRKGRDPEKMEIQDYGLMHELLENLVRGFNDLPVNVLWTATSKKVEDADKNEFLVPELQGKKEYGVAMKMAALMTSYGHMRVEVHDVAMEPDPNDEEKKPRYKKVKRRVIYWEDSGTIRGKDRTMALAPFTVNATLQQVRLAIAGKMKRNAEGFIVKVDAQKASAPVKKAAPPVKKAAPQTSPQPEKAVESKETPDDTKPATEATEVTQVPNVTVAEGKPEEKKEDAVKELDLDAVQA
ncbi:RecA-like DNA recombinase [Mycobacterium phage Labelle]|nr:RecA-like DNA recombinase [Mycobacterium phage Labelle]